MKLRFTRNVLVYAEHRAAGSVHEIKDSDAVMLIADRAAVRETASFAPPAENAAMPPPTKKPRR